MRKYKGITSHQMSTLYRRLRYKGKKHSKAFREVGIAKALSKQRLNSKAKKLKKSKYRYSDWDGDGKVNKYDCRPFNKNRQDDDDYDYEDYDNVNALAETWDSKDYNDNKKKDFIERRNYEDTVTGNDEDDKERFSKNNGIIPLKSIEKQVEAEHMRNVNNYNKARHQLENPGEYIKTYPKNKINNRDLINEAVYGIQGKRTKGLFKDVIQIKTSKNKNSNTKSKNIPTKIYDYENVKPKKRTDEDLI